MISAVELCRQTGLSYRDVDYWTRRGVLIPDVEAAGSGSQRAYSEDEARIARLVGQLRGFGSGLPLLAEVAGQLRRWDEREWTGRIYINSLGFVQRTACATCFVVDLDALARETSSA